MPEQIEPHREPTLSEKIAAMKAAVNEAAESVRRAFQGFAEAVNEGRARPRRTDKDE
ncbi:hypothetical protein [Nocardia nova]|uniref:hypothetical protein n=1 Tax=Nocardia nova TaxID=37330 RepID=UPI0018949532|nr:hypothetical protein [Nocardia nova]MBF6277039.1 hypothetical protein [Nocardia nova]